MTRTDPGAVNPENYATSRGPCRCGHSEASHVFRIVARRKVRGPCSVRLLDGGCGCGDYREEAPAPAPAQPTAEEKLRRIWELHTDSVAGVCPSCATLPSDTDDDGLVDWPCPTILVIDPDAATKFGPVRHG